MEKEVVDHLAFSGMELLGSDDNTQQKDLVASMPSSLKKRREHISADIDANFAELAQISNFPMEKEVVMHLAGCGMEFLESNDSTNQKN